MVENGSLLISEPFLGDPNFERTVILICEHDQNGTFGFILNKPSILTFDAVVSEVSGYDEGLYVGGPVEQNTLHFIYKGEDIIRGSVEIAENVFWGGDYDQVMELINTRQIKSEDFKFFLGYSGWGAGQLEEEMKSKSWIVNSGTAEDIFYRDTDDMWRFLLRKMGGKYKMYSNYPVDPRLN